MVSVLPPPFTPLITVLGHQYPARHCISGPTWHQHPQLYGPVTAIYRKYPPQVPPQRDRSLVGRYRARKQQKIDKLWVFRAFVGENT